MKIRTGFVSNSSSTSFTCDLCGREESGMDMCLSEAEMYRCKNDHTFCRSEIINKDDNDFDPSETNPKYCPLCNFVGITGYDLVVYLLKLVGKTRKDILSEVKSRFSNYDEFNAYLTEKK